MSDVLDSKIENVLDSADRMFIATSVGGNSSGASVFFSRDREDLVFFTFHPTRKAEQIRLNPVFMLSYGLKAKKELKVYRLTESVTK